MSKNNKIFSDSDKAAIIQDATQQINKQLSSEGRRRFLKQGLTLGGLMMLTGCDISSNESVENSLSRISRFNDRVQG